MYADWTKHLATETEKQEFENTIYGARRVLDRLKALIDERQTYIESYENSVKQFDNPNWASKQAYNLGLKSMANIIKKYIDLDQQAIKET